MGRAALIEKSLQNQGSRYLIDDAAMLPARVAGLIEDLVRLMGGEALVAEVDGQAGEFGELGGEGAGFGGLGAFVAGKMQGKADDEGGCGEAAGEAGERTEVFAAVAAALEGEHGLGGKAELVGDGHADAAVADVEGQETGLGGLVQAVPSDFRLKPKAWVKRP